jgi:hypothetical protein
LLSRTMELTLLKEEYIEVPLEKIT